MKRLLIAADGSQGSLAAAALAVNLAGALRQAPELHLAYVHPPVPIGLARQHVAREVLDRYYREEGEAALAPVQAVFAAAGLAVQSHIHVGDPAESIVKLSRSLGCEAIVIGRRGHGALAEIVLGSVARKVLLLSELPVLSVK